MFVFFSFQDCVEIKTLIERPLINSKDINEIFSKKPLSSECNATCCHSVAFISLIRRNINNDGLEFIKVGKLTLVRFHRNNINYAILFSTFNILFQLLK